MIIRFREGCWNYWWLMTACDRVGFVILDLVEIVWELGLSHKIEGACVLVRFMSYP